MHILQQAYEARSKKLNKIEKLKELKNPLAAYEKIEEYAKGGYESIPDEDKKYFLKCFGIYDRPATPQKFMIKLRIPGGHLNSTQARVIGECAKEFGNDYIDLTTRQQCELRYLSIEDMPKLLKRLKDVGLDAYQTGVDNIRAIMCDPLDDRSFDNILPSHKTLLKLQKMFLYSPDWISALPRKFNTAITGSISNRCNAYSHDVSFVLAQKDGIYGYNMYLGGRVGVVGKCADIFLSNEDEVIKAFGAIIEIFKRYGFRDNRNKNRLHFLLEAVGIERMASAIRQKAGVNFATAGEVMTKLDYNDADQGRVLLRDGTFAVHIKVPSGIFSGSALAEVASLSEKYADGEIRFDMEQSIYILGVKDTQTLLKEEFFKKYKNVNTPYFNHLIACAGTQHCPFGVIENKNDAINMSKYLDENVPLEDARIRMYWSACVKGCGIHGLGDIGFEGCKVKVGNEMQGGVNISLGGQLVSEGVEGYTVIRGASLEKAKYYVESLMIEYKRLKKPKENFEQFHTRVLKQYTPSYIGFMMRFKAYAKAKGIELDFGILPSTNTGRNEEFEVFEFGRRLYYALAKIEPYSAYERFSNTLKNEQLRDMREYVDDIDENIFSMLNLILSEKEQDRAEVFSQLTEFIDF